MKRYDSTGTFPSEIPLAIRARRTPSGTEFERSYGIRADFRPISSLDSPSLHHVDTFEWNRESAVATSGSVRAAYSAAVDLPARPSRRGLSREEEAEVGRWAEAARRGDREALKNLFDRYKDDVYRTALLLLSNRSAAEAVAEEAFVRYHRQPPEDGTRFDRWIFRTVVDLCVRHAEEGGGVGPRERLSIDDPERPTAIRRLIAAALHEVPPHARVAFVLREANGFSYERIAALTGEPLDRVGVHLARARAGLAGVLERIEFESWNAG